MTIVISSLTFGRCHSQAEGARSQFVDIGNLSAWSIAARFAEATGLGPREQWLPRFQHWEKEPWTWKRFRQLPISFQILAVLSAAAVLSISSLIAMLLMFR
ncbi:hypothetical protein [Mesorhizobium sp. J8]|uniref:hypothetical protein n=1 Tax=Mesorhizobium sp. J8 TaxID=2777475 RepID=UPI0019152D01|nr:hypothetical protein [Mesorhizobium sp. J8]